MFRLCPWPAFLLWFASGMFILAAPSSKAAQTPRLVNAQFGSPTGYRNRYWDEMRVHVENPGPAREAWITTEHTGYHSGQQMSMRYPIRMGKQSAYHFDFPVWLDRQAPPGKKKIYPVLRVKLDDGNLVTWDHQEVFAVHKPTEDLRLMVCDAHFSSYKFIDGDDSLGKNLTRSPVTVKGLPGRMIYYEGYDILVLGGLGGTALSAAQEEALITWVRAGGILLYTPGADGDVLPPGPLRDLLPVRYGVHHRVARLGFPECESLEAPNGITRYRMLRLRGSVERGREEDPAVVQADEGAGHILACHFNMGNPAFQKWAGARKFILEVLPEIPAGTRYGSRLLENSDAMDTLMGKLTGLTILPRRTLSLYLLVTALVLIGPLALFHLGKRPEWGYALLLVLSLAAGIGTIFAAHFNRSQPAPVLNEVYFASSRSGQDSLTIQASMGLYSPVGRPFDFKTSSDHVMLRPGASAIRPPAPFNLEFPGRLRLRDWHVRAKDQRIIYGTGIRNDVELPHCSFLLSDQGLSLEAENTTSQPMEGAFGLINRLEIPLGEIPAGGRIDQAGIRPQTAAERAGKSGSMFQGAGNPIRSFLREQLLPEKSNPFRLMKYVRGLPDLDRTYQRGQPGLFSWSKQPLFPMQTDSAELSRKAVGLWQTVGKLEVKPGRVVVPMGIMPMQVAHKGPGILLHPNGSLSGRIPTWCNIRFTLPVGMPEFQPKALRAFFALEGKGYTGELLIAPAGASTQEVESFTVLGGAGVYALKNPENYFDPATRSLVLGFKINRQHNANTEAIPIGARDWNVSLLDIEIEGTVP